MGPFQAFNTICPGLRKTYRRRLYQHIEHIITIITIVFCSVIPATRIYRVVVLHYTIHNMY